MGKTLAFLEHSEPLREHLGQDSLAINTDLNSVIKTAVLSLAVLLQISHYFDVFEEVLF